MTKPVHFATPTEGYPRVEHAMFREWLVANAGPRFRLQMSYVEGYPACSTRNKIVLNFLESDAEILMMMDDDQAPTFNPLDFINDDLDILGFPYPTIRVNEDPPIVWFPQAYDPEMGLVQAKSVGGGLTIIQRRVLEHPDMRAPYIDEFNEDGIFYTGEDITFCTRAMDAGFTVWCQMDKPLLHTKPAEMLRLWMYANGIDQI